MCFDGIDSDLDKKTFVEYKLFVSYSYLRK